MPEPKTFGLHVRHLGVKFRDSLAVLHVLEGSFVEEALPFGGLLVGGIDVAVVVVVVGRGGQELSQA